MAVISEIKLKQLPKEYQEVEYIESSGKQYINVDYIPKINDLYKVKFSHTNITGNQVIFGSRTSGKYSDSLNQIYLNKSVASGMENHMLFFSGTIQQDLFLTEINKIYDLELSANSSNFDNSSSQPLYLFCFNVLGSSSVYAFIKLYKFEIINNNTVMRNLIPCYRKSDNVVGMYDLVENKFYSNAGEGAFSVGEDVNKYMGEYDQETIRNINLNNTNYHFAKQKEIYLPKEYQRVKYIEGTGTQYIKTGFKPQFADNGYRIEVKFETKTLKNYESILGCRSSSTEKRLDVWWGETGAGGYGLSGTLNNSMKTAMVSNTYYNLVLSGEVVKNGVVDNTNPLNYKINSNYELYVFATNTADTASNIASVKFYGLEVYQGGILSLNLIPCYRKADNVVGVYDVISETFLTNAGTGDFVKGNDVFEVSCENAVEEPLIDMQISGECEQQSYTGKNLYDHHWLFEGDSVTMATTTYTKTDEGILVNGYSDTTVCQTSLAESKELKGLLEVGKNYYMSTNGQNVTTVFYSKTGDVSNWSNSKTITGNEDTIKIYMQINKGIAYEDVLVKIQLEQGNSGTEYEPYVGGVASPNPEYPQEVESVGEKTKNLFSFYGREENNFNNYGEPTSEKVIGQNQYVIGFARNGYVKPLQIAKYDISNPKDIVINSLVNGYGIGLSYLVKAGEKYFVQLSEWTNCTIGMGYFNASGVNIGHEYVRKNSSFTIPDECVWLFLCLVPEGHAINVDVHFKDLVFIKTDEELSLVDYEPYGYKVPVKVSGKNKYSAKTGVYSGVRLLSLDSIKVKPNTDYVISVDKYTNKEPMFAIKYVDEPVYNLTPQESWATGTQFKSNTNKFNSENYEYILIRCWSTNEEYGIDENTKIQIEEGTVKTEFEPYVEPTTINLYLAEPLRNIGKYFDYIDYKNKKVVRNVKEKIYQTSEEMKLGKQGTNYNSLVISLSEGLVFDSYSLAMSNYFQSGGNASAVYNNPDTQLNKIVYQGTYHRCFASISNQIVNSNSEIQSWVETLYNNGTPLKILYPIEPIEEAIDIPEIVMCKGTNIFDVDTKTKPSELKINYWKQI